MIGLAVGDGDFKWRDAIKSRSEEKERQGECGMKKKQNCQGMVRQVVPFEEGEGEQVFQSRSRRMRGQSGMSKEVPEESLKRKCACRGVRKEKVKHES